MDPSRAPAAPPLPRTGFPVALYIVASAALLGAAALRLGRDGAGLGRAPALTAAVLGESPADWRPARPPSAAPSETLRPVTFRLLAPAAQSVFVGGSFNDFNAAEHPMERSTDGLWEATVRLAPGRHEYKFKVDGRWEVDPANPERTPAPRECSLIEVAS